MIPWNKDEDKQTLKIVLVDKMKTNNKWTSTLKTNRDKYRQNY